MTLVTGGLQAAETLSAGSCSVRLLTAADADELPRRYRDVVVPPTERFRQAIRTALGLMPELTCQAARRLVFVEDASYVAEDGWVPASAPDLIFLNYSSHLSTAKVSQSFLHEATHAADQLLNAQRADVGLIGRLTAENLYPNGAADAAAWPAAAQLLAKKIVADNRLGGGLRAEWVRIQRSFQAFGLASDYTQPGKASAVEPASAGFTSAYGSSDPGEDIAEFASWMLAGRLFVAGDRDLQNRACRAMQLYKSSMVPSDLAALFTKANFLLSTGLVTPAAYQACVGQLRLPDDGVGIHVYGVDGETGRSQRHFTDDVKVGIGTYEKLQDYVFTYAAGGKAEAGGKEYPATVYLRLVLAPASRELALVSWPRGVYDLRTLGNRFDVESPDYPAGSFAGIEGTILVAYATRQRIEGSVFLKQAVRVHAPAPVPIPQTGLPLRFVFRATR
jgi:hypothetical protein